MKNPFLFCLIIILLNAGNMAIAQEIAIENRRLTHAYPQIDNDLNIIVENESCRNIIVKTDNGKLVQHDSINYPCSNNFIPKRTGIAKLTILKISGRDTIRLGERIIRIKKWPEHKAMIGNQYSGEMSRSLFMVQGGIRVPVMLNDINGYIRVVSYKVEVIRAGNLLFEFKNEGGMFEEKNKSRLAQVRSNDEVRFSEIKIMMPGETVASEANNIYIRIH